MTFATAALLWADADTSRTVAILQADSDSSGSPEHSTLHSFDFAKSHY